MKKIKVKNHPVKLFEWKGIHLIILFIVPFLLYAQTFSFGFSFLDDDSMILKNTSILAKFNLQKIFFSDAWFLDKSIELYRPMQSLSYAVDYFFSGVNGSSYHVQNVLIFCIGIQLLYFLLISFNISEQNSFYLSLFYSVHFLFVHAACWIPARGDLYLFLFSVLSILTFFLYNKTQKTIYIILTSLFYFCALLSKESAIVLLPLIYIVAGLFWKLNWKKTSNYYVLIISSFFTSLFLWMRSVSVFKSDHLFNFNDFLFNLRTIPEEIFKFYVPLNFSVMPAFNSIVTISGFILMALILIFIFIFRLKINKNILLAGLSFFLLPLLPSMFYHPVFAGFAYDYLDHRMFFPGIGLLLITFSLLHAVTEKKYPGYYFYIPFSIMALITFNFTKNYADSTYFYENAIKTNPGSSLAWVNYGSCLIRENKYADALNKFNYALKLSPQDIKIRMKLADAYHLIKDDKKMIEQCKTVISIDNKFTMSYYMIALYYSDMNRKDSAMFYVNRSVQANPKNAESYFYKALLLKKTGLNDSALICFSKAISLNNKYALAYFQQGSLYADNGKFNEALNDFEQYVKLNPDDGTGYFYRGQAKCFTGQKEEGCLDLHEALKMGITEAQSKIDYWCK